MGTSQFIDARDLADWMLHCLEQNITGVHNANGFARSGLDVRTMLGACKCATSASRRDSGLGFSEEFLAREQASGPTSQMPVWIPREGRRMMVKSDKATAAGLKFRPIGDTDRATPWQWAKTERGDRRLANGASPAEREKEAASRSGTNVPASSATTDT